MKFYVFVSYDYSNGELIEFDDFENALKYYQKESKDNDSALLFGVKLSDNYHT